MTTLLPNLKIPKNSYKKKFDERMQVVENKLKENHHKFLSMLNDVVNKAKTARHLAQFNSIVQTENAEKIKCVNSDVNSLKNEIEKPKMKSQNFAMKLMTPRKEQFKKIIQEQIEKITQKVARKIKEVIPEILFSKTVWNMEGAHCSTSESFANYETIIVKFSDWGFSEDIKSTSIKTPTNENCKYVSQMNSSTITSHRNDAV